MNGQVFILRVENARPRMKAVWEVACRFLELGKSAKVVICENEPQRTLDQNAKLNAMCGEVADQIRLDLSSDRYVNVAECPRGLQLSKDDWRHMFVAAYRKERRIVPGVNGGYVVLGESSRSLRVKECADVIELVYAFGAEHGVEWSEPT